MNENEDKVEENKSKVLRMYIIQGVSLVLPIAIFLVFYIYWRAKEDLKSTWLESHGHWQIKTAMIYMAVMLFVIAVIVLGYGADHTSIKDLALLMGAFILIGVLNVWVLYRLYVGLVQFGESSAITK